MDFKSSVILANDYRSCPKKIYTSAIIVESKLLLSQVHIVMSPNTQCLSCGAIFLEAVGPCVHCGGPVEVSVSLVGSEVKCSAGQVGKVVDNRTSLDGQEIRYTASTGSQSNASLECNLLSVQVKPPIDMVSRES